MNFNETMALLSSYQDEKLKKHTLKQTIDLDAYGIKMQDIRALAKKIGIDHELGQSLFQTSIYEALMLGSLILDPDQITHDDLEKFVIKAESTYIIDQGISSVFLKTKNYEMLLDRWMDEKNMHLKYGAFALLSSYFRLESLDAMHQSLGEKALSYIKTHIKDEPLAIQNAMNNAVVMAGLHVPSLNPLAHDVADHIGHVMPRVALNKCNIQSAKDYLVRYETDPKFSRFARLKKKS